MRKDQPRSVKEEKWEATKREMAECLDNTNMTNQILQEDKTNLHKIENNLAEHEYQTGKANYLVSGMKSIFGVFFKKKHKKRPKEPTYVDPILAQFEDTNVHYVNEIKGKMEFPVPSAPKKYEEDSEKGRDIMEFRKMLGEVKAGQKRIGMELDKQNDKLEEIATKEEENTEKIGHVSHKLWKLLKQLLDSLNLI